jgi:hypothetical protein
VLNCTPHFSCRFKLQAVVIFSFLFVMVNRANASPNHQASPDTRVVRAPGLRGHIPAKPQELRGGTWRTDHSFEATLRIRNVLVIGPLDVTPVLYLADGTEFVLPQVHFTPGEVKTISINNALSSAPPEIAAHISDYGSVALRFNWGWATAIQASVESLDASRSLVFDFGLDSPMEMPASLQELNGLWWKRDEGVEGFAFLTNVTSKPVHVAVHSSLPSGVEGASHEVMVLPNRTERVLLSELLDDGQSPHSKAKAGGLSIRYRGTPGAIFVAGGLENPDEGYSTLIPVYQHSAGSRGAY